MIVCLDPGHGGTDPGATEGRLIEKTLNHQLQFWIFGDLLKAGHQVITTRDYDNYISPSNRAKYANLHKADVFISLHHNSVANERANGIECLHYLNSIKGFEMAERICEHVAARWDIANRGPKVGYYRGDRTRPILPVLRKTAMPAILIEACFLSSPRDRTNCVYWIRERIPFYKLISKAIQEALKCQQ